MTTLYLDRKNLSLRADSSALVCYENDKRVATVPLKILQRVCIRGDLTLSAKVLGKLGETGIGVLILSGRQKTPRPHVAQLETGRTKAHGTICPVAR